MNTWRPVRQQTSQAISFFPGKPEGTRNMAAITPAKPKANIRLVDDQRENLLALEAVLEELGHELVFTRSGEEALRLVQQREFAVVLLDVHMHGLDGFETAK